MKNIVSLVIGLFITISSFTQITEGKMNYTLDFNSSDPQMQAQLAMLKGSTVVMYISPDFTRMEMNMGMFVQITTIVDIKAQESLNLFGGMMGKKAYKMSTKSAEDKELPEIEIEKTKETKKIAGYKCTKYIVTTEDGGVLNMWTTEEITASKEGNKYMNNKISGFPLEFDVSAKGLTMTFTATAVEKGLKAYNLKELFNTDIPADYELIDPKEFEGMGL